MRHTANGKLNAGGQYGQNTEALMALYGHMFDRIYSGRRLIF